MISLTPVNDTVIDELRSNLTRVCAVSKPFRVVAHAIDHTVLSELDTRAFDDGSPPLGWIDWWLSMGERIQSFDRPALFHALPGLLGKTRVQTIHLIQLKELMDQRQWTLPAGVVLAWGVPAEAMNKDHLRTIDCTGALGVDIDGCAAVLMAPEETCADWPW